MIYSVLDRLALLRHRYRGVHQKLLPTCKYDKDSYESNPLPRLHYSGDDRATRPGAPRSDIQALIQCLKYLKVPVRIAMFQALQASLDGVISE